MTRNARFPARARTLLLAAVLLSACQSYRTGGVLAANDQVRVVLRAPRPMLGITSRGDTLSLVPAETLEGWVVSAGADSVQLRLAGARAVEAGQQRAMPDARVWLARAEIRSVETQRRNVGRSAAATLGVVALLGIVVLGVVVLLVSAGYGE